MKSDTQSSQPVDKVPASLMPQQAKVPPNKGPEIAGFLKTPTVEEFALPKCSLSVSTTSPSFDNVTDSEIAFQSSQWTSTDIVLGLAWHPKLQSLLANVRTQGKIYAVNDPTGAEKKSSLAVFLEGPASFRLNGLSFDLKGQPVIPAMGLGKVIRGDGKGKMYAVSETSEIFSDVSTAPTEAVSRSDGSIYFVDPGFGGNVVRTSSPFIYRILLDGKIVKYVFPEALCPDQQCHPLGISFSPDEKILYVVDLFRGQKVGGLQKVQDTIYKFTVDSDGGLTQQNGILTGGAVFTVLNLNGSGAAGTASQIRVDVQGNLYATGPSGVKIFSPAGKFLKQLIVKSDPDPFAVVYSLAWGGPQNQSLYLATTSKIFKLSNMPVPGISPGSRCE